MDQKKRIEGSVSMEDIGPWAPTIQKVRDALIAQRICAADMVRMRTPGIDPKAAMYVPSHLEVDMISESGREAILAGRLIDFGYLPNAVIKYGGIHGGDLFNESALAMPFLDPWVFYHTWEEGPSVYLVQQLVAESDDPESCVEIVEMLTVAVKGNGVLLIGDRAIIWPHGDEPNKYKARAAPSQFRFFEGYAEMANMGRSPESAAAGNVGDPLMTALLILNTDGLRRQTIVAPERLNRSRVKSGKIPIPPYDQVSAEPYVTAVLSRGRRRERGDGLGGTHASPVPHIRMGHFRNYASGKRSFIRDTLVNANDDARQQFRAARSHYEIKK